MNRPIAWTFEPARYLQSLDSSARLTSSAFILGSWVPLFEPDQVFFLPVQITKSIYGSICLLWLVQDLVWPHVPTMVKFLELAISDLSQIWTWCMHNISYSLNHWVKSMLQDNIVKYGPRYKVISWPQVTCSIFEPGASRYLNHQAFSRPHVWDLNLGQIWIGDTFEFHTPGHCTTFQSKVNHLI